MLQLLLLFLKKKKKKKKEAEEEQQQQEFGNEEDDILEIYSDTEIDYKEQRNRKRNQLVQQHIQQKYQPNHQISYLNLSLDNQRRNAIYKTRDIDFNKMLGRDDNDNDDVDEFPYLNQQLMYSPKYQATSTYSKHSIKNIKFNQAKKQLIISKDHLQQPTLPLDIIKAKKSHIKGGVINKAAKEKDFSRQNQADSNYNVIDAINHIKPKKVVNIKFNKDAKKGIEIKKANVVELIHVTTGNIGENHHQKGISFGSDIARKHSIKISESGPLLHPKNPSLPRVKTAILPPKKKLEKKLEKNKKNKLAPLATTTTPIAQKKLKQKTPSKKKSQKQQHLSHNKKIQSIYKPYDIDKVSQTKKSGKKKSGKKKKK